VCVCAREHPVGGNNHDDKYNNNHNDNHNQNHNQNHNNNQINNNNNSNSNSNSSSSIIIIIADIDIDIDLRCNSLPLLDAFSLVDVPQKNHVQLIRGMGSCWCTTPFTKLASKRFRPPLARTPRW